jgi:hypothetical protein
MESEGSLSSLVLWSPSLISIFRGFVTLSRQVPGQYVKSATTTCLTRLLVHSSFKTISPRLTQATYSSIHKDLWNS